MAYDPLDTTTTDNYQERLCPGSRKLIVQISNAAVLIGFGEGGPAPMYGTDEPYLPIVGTLVRDFDAIRVRSYTKGVAAQVKLIPVP